MGDAEAFAREFRPVPPARPGVCRICHAAGPEASGAGSSGPRVTGAGACAGCRRTIGGLRGHTEHVVPITLTARNTRLYDVVTQRREPPGGRRGRLDLLAATVARFHQRHAACLERAAGGPFTLVATVPSTRAERPIEAFDPMAAVVARVAALAGRHRPLLLERVDSEPGAAAGDAFRVRGGGLEGARTLLVDDLFVSGARVQHAASALLAAGAAAVVALVVARLVEPAAADPCGAAIWREAGRRPFDFVRCCVCDAAPWEIT
ncbi:hypothetical protein MF672_034325 [Actinomadura sp. ATCC 31491]|uniref:Phosphoribosyltransferase domain-containing protein n=1 Tax=Actinomadura luzonensis TaxID=2805427 RepID=A0ABT0G3W5_9ACTN|nr:hypothetical protein [Actinomadura luzonensis]MCK2218833.1 hypothetical protein [Actinomadura luzonensis]